MEKTALPQSNVRGNILNPESYYHNSSALVAKTHALSLARQDFLQLRRGGRPILSSSASGQFLAPSSHWCLGGKLLPEPHVQKLSAMGLTLITAFLQSCRCPEGATGNLVPSMAPGRRDWTESFRDALIPGQTSRPTQPRPCMSQLCECSPEVIFCLCALSLKIPNPRASIHSPVSIFVAPPVSNLWFTSN